MSASPLRAPNEAQAIARMIRTSPRKMGLVAAMIRNLKVYDAMVQLEFSKRRIAKDVLKCLKSAVANAENNHNLDVDRLVVSEAIVGKAMVMKRSRARARGRGAKILKPFSHLSITVREALEK
jgi:large subunit ribosomal protein L22